MLDFITEHWRMIEVVLEFHKVVHEIAVECSNEESLLWFFN